MMYSLVGLLYLYYSGAGVSRTPTPVIERENEFSNHLAVTGQRHTPTGQRHTLRTQRQLEHFEQLQEDGAVLGAPEVSLQPPAVGVQHLRAVFLAVEVVGVLKRTPKLVRLGSTDVKGVRRVGWWWATRVEYAEEPTSTKGGDENAGRTTH